MLSGQTIIYAFKEHKKLSILEVIKRTNKGLTFCLLCCPREINRKLDAIGSLVCLSPGYQEPVVEYRNSPSPLNDYDEDDEIIIVSDTKRKRPLRNEDRDVAREISLKFRCRTELHKIPILSVSGVSIILVFFSHLDYI